MISPCPIQGVLFTSPSQHDACLQQMDIWPWCNVLSCPVPEYQPLSLLGLLKCIQCGRILFYHHCQWLLALPLPGPQDSTPSSLGLSGHKASLVLTAPLEQRALRGFSCSMLAWEWEVLRNLELQSLGCVLALWSQTNLNIFMFSTLSSLSQLCNL